MRSLGAALLLALNVAVAFGAGGSHFVRSSGVRQLLVQTVRGDTIALQVSADESVESVRRCVLACTGVCCAGRRACAAVHACLC